MTYYLVQRLSLNEHPFERQQGFDRVFSCEYMGSAEFEFGTVPQALKRLREAPVEARALEVTIDGVSREVHFVGHPETLTQARDDLEA